MRTPFQLTAGTVIVRFENQTPLFLALRAYANWDFAKGRVEPGEDPFQGAIREAEEETGIKDLNFKWGQEFIETEPYANKKIGRFFVAETQTKDVKLSREHHEYRWLPFNDAIKLFHPRLKRVLTWAAEKVGSTDLSETKI